MSFESVTTTQESIVIGEKTYTVLFPDLVRPLTDRERQELKDSIARFGVKQEVVTDEQNGIIDGINRARIASELGFVAIPTRIVECGSDEEKRQLGLSLNIDRRHLSPVERQAAIESRRQRMQQARVAGKSLRAIAKEEGVSKSQVERDLAASGVPDGTAEKEELSPSENESAAPSDIAVSVAPNLPADNKASSAPAETTAKVKGRDGKRYPSQRRRKPTTKPSPSKTNDPAPRKCNIKGLIKGVKSLVEQGKIAANVAKSFAEKHDAAQQKEIVSGKNEDDICAAIRTWNQEQWLLSEARRILQQISIVRLSEWDTSKASPECRQQIALYLYHARDVLAKLIAHAEKETQAQDNSSHGSNGNYSVQAEEKLNRLCECWESAPLYARDKFMERYALSGFVEMAQPAPHADSAKM